MSQETHHTPSHFKTWLELSITALNDVERTDLLRLGHLKRAGTDVYAARRVWYRTDYGQRSAIVIAKDEPMGAFIEAEGHKWYPHSVWGCDGCSVGCERHGHEFLAGRKVQTEDVAKWSEEQQDAQPEAMEPTMRRSQEPKVEAVAIPLDDARRAKDYLSYLNEVEEIKGVSRLLGRLDEYIDGREQA